MIHPINLWIANAYLIKGRRPVLVDTGAPNSRPRLERALARLNVRPQDVALVLLSHAHSDHAGSAAALQQAWGAPLAVHPGDAPMLQRGTNGSFISMDLEARISRPFVDRPFPGTRADLLLSDGQDLSEYGIPARLMHTPGHSDGSISLIFEDGRAIIGDLVRGGFLGGVLLPHRPNGPYFMPTRSAFPLLLNSLQRVLEAGAQQLYVGHGGPISRQSAQRWLDAQQRNLPLTHLTQKG